MSMTSMEAERERVAQIMFLADEYALAKEAAGIEHVTGQVSRYVHQEAEEKAARRKLGEFVRASIEIQEAAPPEPSFMEQFDRARRSFEAWPQWMKDAARIATASLPATPQSEPAPEPESHLRKWRRVIEGPQSEPAAPPKQSGWISVEERLPKAEERVLFYDLNRNHPVRCYGFKASDDDDSTQWIDVVNRDCDGEPTDTYEVTHWMPLPDPPSPLPEGERK